MPVPVDPLAAQQLVDRIGDDLRLRDQRQFVAIVDDRQPADPGSADRRPARKRLARGRRVRAEAALVEDLRDEAVDVRMQPVGRGQEQARAPAGTVQGVTDEVLQRRYARALRMDPLADLRQLVRIARAGRGRRRPADAASVLARLSWPASSMNRTSTASSRSVRAHSQTVPAAIGYPPVASSGATSFASSTIRTPVGAEPASPSDFWIAAKVWRGLGERRGGLVEEIRDRLVRLGRDTDLLSVSPRAPRSSGLRSSVLPVPGGPWIGSTP